MLPNPQFPPQGALRQPDGSVVWRIWAPRCESLALITCPGDQRQETPMTRDSQGYYIHREPDVDEGLRYAYKPDDGGEYPDPASRWQPEGVHRPSAVFSPEAFRWADQQWRGLHPDELVLYELHVGTFTAEGTLDAVIPRLPALIELGVTAIELMPVAQFPGDRNWGYDGVHPYAVQNTYGGPQALQRLVDAAHRAGLGVFLDVIYNHVGPEGNYLGLFGHYFTDRYHTPWGDAVNYDGPHCDAVRQFVVENARMWVRDFHIDGLRLDAVHAIYDFSARHILEDIQEGVREEAARQGRIVHVIAETNQNDVRQISPTSQGGYGLDGVWNDDFHHSVRALLTGQRDGYYQDFGRPEHLAKAFNRVFVYDGNYSPYRQRRHGSRVGELERTQFVICIHNHDQIGNRPQGDRPSTFLSDSAQRLACGLLGLSPCVPLLFMGEEYGETRPFPFFCSFLDPELIEAVRRGRWEEFAALKFNWGGKIPDPQAPETYRSAKLCWQWPQGTPHAQMRQLYRDMLAARRRWPALRDRSNTSAELAGLDHMAAGPTDEDADPAAPILVIRRGSSNDLIACANLTSDMQPRPPLELGTRQVLLSTEELRYGGSRTAKEPRDSLLPYELIIFGPSEWR